jgi:hypothetical protein
MALDYKRPTQELEEEIDFARGEIAIQKDADYLDQLRGIVAALEWVLGRESVSPASFQVQRLPDWRAQLLEAVRAGEIETDVRPMPEGVSKHYARGIASALRWTAGDTDITPS